MHNRPKAKQPKDGESLSKLEKIQIAAPSTADPAVKKRVEEELNQYETNAPNEAKEEIAELNEQIATWDELQRQSLAQDISERKAYAARIFTLICGWLWGVGFLILASGIRGFEFDIPENVLLAIVGSTTLNVLGIFYVVTKYLFPENRNGKPPEK